jgi:hypothetical protein
VSEERDDLTAADEAMRVLRAELSVSPSPDLAARVRSRLAPRREPWRAWGWLVTAAAAVLLIGSIVWMRTSRVERPPAVAVVSPAPPPTVASETPAPAPSTEPVLAPRRPAARRTLARQPIAPVRPIVPPGEEMRIARYAESVRRMPFAADALPESDPRELLADPAPIEIVPLKTAPLVPDEGSLR